MNRELLTFYGLKCNPFATDCPSRASWPPQRWRASAAESNTTSCARADTP